MKNRSLENQAFSTARIPAFAAAAPRIHFRFLFISIAIAIAHAASSATRHVMKNHEWHEYDSEAQEKRFFRAGKFNKKWKVMTTLKSDTDWATLDPVPLEVLDALRNVLLNKYQRRRIPYEDLLVINQMIEDVGGPPALGRN